MDGRKTAVVTGATSGIGRAAAAELAALGYDIIGVGRDAGRCAEASGQLRKLYPQIEVKFLECDLSSQKQIRALAAAILQITPVVDVLINNAGTVSSHFMTTEDGIELQLAVNHLAGFLLTHELLPALRRSPAARVITVSSGSHYHTRLNFDDLQMRRHYHCLGAYKRSKLCNVLFTVEFNRLMGEGSSVRAFAADPGLVKTEIGLKGTFGVERLFWKLRMLSGVEASRPGAAIAWLANEPALQHSGKPYWYDRTSKDPSPFALREDAARLLWEASERLCMVNPDSWA